MTRKKIIASLETILFYPRPGSKPKVRYFVKPAANPKYMEIPREYLVDKIYRLVLQATNDLKLSADTREKARLAIETDNKTTPDVALSTGKERDAYDAGIIRPSVRALYTNQIYYISTDKETLGISLMESLATEALTENNKQLNEDARYVGDYRGFSIYKEVGGGYWAQKGYTDDVFDEEFESKAEIKKAIDDYIKDGLGDRFNESLTEETKRYIKRYYIRPQNIVCSNKEEILKALVEIGDENCSVYSLKRLDNHDDVHLLTNSDIIYYYDDGILYDKNHVKVMDYELGPKHEEERKKVNDVDELTNKEFSNMYDDRLTDADLTNDKTIKVKEDLNEDWDSLNDWNNLINDSTFKKGTFNSILFNNCEISFYPEEVIKTITTESTEEFGLERFINSIPVEAIEYIQIDNNIIDPDTLADSDLKAIENAIINSQKASNAYCEIASQEGQKLDFFEDNANRPDDPDMPLKEENYPENPFDLHFESYNANGKRIVEGKEVEEFCCICGEPLNGYGNNPVPYKEEGRCCDACNIKFVIPARLAQMYNQEAEKEDKEN